MAVSVSVILCVKNGMPYLPKQLDALAGQSWSGDWELLFVDNCCTDDSVAVARRYKSRLPVRIIEAYRQTGLSYARNAGAAASAGEVLLFCDADDEVDPAWISEGAAALTKADFIGGALRVERINDPASQWARPDPTPGRLPTALDYLPFAMGANFGVRREAYAAVGGCDEQFVRCGDDIDLSWRLTRAGYPPHWAPTVIADYRLRPPGAAVFRQQLSYAEVAPVLYRKHAAYGCKRPAARAVLRDWRYLLTHPHVLTRSDHVGAGARQLLATRAGHLSGALRERTLFY